MELEYEIQCKIINAAVRLSKEKGIGKNVKTERIEAAQRAQVRSYLHCRELWNIVCWNLWSNLWLPLIDH